MNIYKVLNERTGLKKKYVFVKDKLNNYLNQKPKTIKVMAWFLMIMSVIGSSVYVGYKQAKTGPFLNRYTETDIFSYNTIFRDISTGSEFFIHGIHSFLIKWPLFWLEDALGFTENIHIIFSIMIMVAMTFGVLYLVYRFSNRNNVLTVIIGFALAIMTLLANPNYDYMTISWLTIRNIEIPLFIWSMIALTRNTNYRFRTLVTILLAILMASDKLLLFISLAAVIIYEFIKLIKTKRIIIQWKNLLSVFTAGLGALLIELLINSFTSVNLRYAYNPTQQIVGSIETFVTQTLDAINSLLYVFGADFFGDSPKAFIFHSVGAVVLLLAIISSFQVMRRRSVSMTNRPYGQKEALLLVSIAASFLAFYILIERPVGSQARFLTPLLAIGVCLIAINYSKHFVNARNKFVLTVIVVAGLLLGGSLILAQKNYSEYQTSHGNNNELYQTLVGAIKDYDIDIVSGRAWVGNLQYVYRNIYPDDVLQINYTSNCNIVNPAMINTQWYKTDQSVERTALLNLNYEEGCSYSRMVSIYGEPARIVPTGDYILYIYDYDIRVRYDTSNVK